MRKIFYIIILTAVISKLTAQIDPNIALKYYQDGEFDKAAVYYEELYKKSKSKTYFSYYIKSLIELKLYVDAEKIIKKQIRSYKNDLSYLVDLGVLYKVSGEENKAEEEYQAALKKITPNKSQISNLANKFLREQEYNYAEQVYLKAEKILKNYDFTENLISIYLYSKSFDKLIKKYFLLIEKGYSLEKLKNKLQYSRYFDKENELMPKLKIELLKKLQEKKVNNIYYDLLIWIYSNENDYEKALDIAIALDNRNKNSNGNRIIEIGEFALNNKDYKIATTAFKHLLDSKIGEQDYFFRAKIKTKYLDARFKKIRNSNYLNEELKQLKTEYLSTINEIKLNRQSFNLFYNLSIIDAYYLNETDTAIARLEHTLKFSNLLQSQKADAKILLADLYLFSDNIAEATLTYAQVEHDNKDNHYGNKAKLKKAKLAYYSGDFFWAQAQLDILKASTSKLISNDAIFLSSIIADNIEDDTNTTALEKYAKADLLFYQKKYNQSINILDSINKLFLYHKLTDEILYKKAEIYLDQNRNTEAIKFLQKIITDYHADILSDDAVFLLAELYDKKLNNKEKAMEYYKKYMTEFKDNIHIEEVRQRYRQLRGDF